MLKTFLENCKNPRGRFGKFIINAMNKGHGPLSRWAFKSFPPVDGEAILDAGCGGGGNLVRILEQCPSSSVTGIDYSPVSVECSVRVTRKFGDRCRVVLGNVMELPFKEETFDRVVSFESVYFWPDPVDGLREICRVLKPKGKVMLASEMTDPGRGKFWTEHCSGMKIYTGEELVSFLEKAGFGNIRLSRAHRVWCALEGTKGA